MSLRVVGVCGLTDQGWWLTRLTILWSEQLSVCHCSVLHWEELQESLRIDIEIFPIVTLVSEGQTNVNLALEVGCRVQVDIWDGTGQNKNKKISENVLFLTPCPGEGCRSSSSSVHHLVLFWFRGENVADLFALEQFTFLSWIFHFLHSHW